MLLALIAFPIIPARAETQDGSGGSPLDDIDIGELVDGTEDEIDDVLGGPVEDVGDVVDDVEDEVGDVVDDVEDEVGDVVDDVEDEVGDVVDDVDGVVDDVLGGVDDVLGGIDDVLGGLLDQLEGALDSVLDLPSQIGIPDIGGIFENADGSMGDDSGSAGEETAGALGLPDPSAVAQNVEAAETAVVEELFATKQASGGGSPVVKGDAMTQVNTNTAREVAESSALGQEAQETLVENSQTATQALQQSTELAADSEEQDVSQNIMRNVSGQLAAGQQTDTLLALDAQARKRDDAIRNQLTADAVEQLQRDRIAERRTDAAAFSSAITQGGQFSLWGAPEE